MALTQNILKLHTSDEKEKEAVTVGSKMAPAQVQTPVLVPVSIPEDAVNRLSPPPTTTPLKPLVPPLGFRLNGRLIPLLPGVGGVQLDVHFHPPGSKSSLTSIHLPYNLSVAQPPAAGPTPIISGEAAHKLLNSNIKSHSPQLKTPPPAIVTSPVTSPKPRPQKPKISVARVVTKPQTLLRKASPVRLRPPDCTFCRSHFRPVPELRGFTCMCSTEITLSLKNLKKKKKKVKHKDRSTLSRRVSRPQPYSPVNKSICPPQKPRAPDRFLSDQVPSPALSPSPRLNQFQAEVQVQSESRTGGKLVIRLEDFYYGSAPGHSTDQIRFSAVYRCIHCSRSLSSNTRLMKHMMEHVSETTECFCSHCFREFPSPFSLQCHLEAVHSSYSSTVKCQICEVNFGNEMGLLFHMKNTHKPGEMPYTCQVCGFRSSFFSDVLTHFEEVHSDTKNFLCQYCLRVFRQTGSYQQHVGRHQKKQVYSCNRCRLQFLYLHERQEHQQHLHRTHLQPAQLSGLRPGTRVTVRTFCVASEAQLELKHIVAPPKTEPSVKQETRKRRSLESLGPILAHLDRSEASRCLECLHRVEDFQAHFPTRIHCSRCRFQTCCSRAFANHMINNHSTNRKCPLYHSIFTSCPRSGSRLHCDSCGFSSLRGDVMAQHLVVSPEHTCVLSHSAVDEEEEEEVDSDPSPDQSRPSGGFVPIGLLQNSSQLSITALKRPAYLQFPVAMTVTFRGPGPSSKPPAPLTVSQLSVLLFALLHGELPASRRYGVSAALIGRWAHRQEQQVAYRKWRWDSGGGARWVLTEREQNRSVTEDTLMELSCRALGPAAKQLTRLNWAVDFLLRHELGVNTRRRQRVSIPQELRDLSRITINNTWDKVKCLSVPPSRFCSLDEFPVFAGPDSVFAGPEALRLWGGPDEVPLLELVLCGSSDGSLLRPLLLFRGELPPLPQGFPQNILLESRPEGFSPRERVYLWTHQVWRPYLGSLSDPALLLLDEHSGHMTEDFLEELRASSTELVHVPEGCSCLVQPLDVCLKPVLREFLQVRWSQLVSVAPEGLTVSDLVLTLGCWFSEVCSLLNSEKHFLKRSFLCVSLMHKSSDEVQRLNRALSQALLQTPPLSSSSQSEPQGQGAETETPQSDTQQEVAPRTNGF